MRILGALNFRLPRRINFRSPARLNLKPALAIKFKACFLELDRALRNFKIYRATLVCHVNLDTAFARLNFKIVQHGDKFNPQRALFCDFGGLAEEPIHLGDQNFLAVLRAVCELGKTCLGGAYALTRIARLCGVVLRIGGS